MKIVRESEKYELIKDRKKCIIIEDSFMKYFGVFTKSSAVLTPRNPYKKDEDQIDYDMDSEEEWNELNGEDLDNKQNDEEDEEEKQIIEEI